MIQKFKTLSAGKGFIYATFMLFIPLGIPAIIVYEGYKNRKYLIKKTKVIVWKLKKRRQQ